MLTRQGALSVTIFGILVVGSLAWLLWPSADPVWRTMGGYLGLVTAFAAAGIVVTCLSLALTKARWRRGAYLLRDHSGACWASLRNIRKLGLLPRFWQRGRRNTGLLLGRYRGRKIYYRGPAHLWTQAPTRSGKGASIVVPNLLTLSDRSVVVMNPKGELDVMTAEHRRERLGQPAYDLTPWKLHGMGTCNYNPLDEIRIDRNINAAVSAFASVLAPRPANVQNADFWSDLACDLLGGLILNEKAHNPAGCTLMQLRKLVRLPQPVLEGRFEQMASDTETFGGLLADFANPVLNDMRGAEKMWLSVLAEARRATRCFDQFGELADTLHTSDFSFTDLPRTRTTVYITMPVERIEQYRTYFQLLVTLAIECVARTPGPYRTLFLLDEFQNLGNLPIIETAFGQYTSQGVQLWPIVQDSARVTKTYGREGVASMLENAEVIQVFNPGGGQKEQIRRNAGQRHVALAVPSLSGSADQVSYGTNIMTLPLVTERHLKALCRDRQLIFMRGHVIWASRILYYRMARWWNWWKPNPIERHPKRAWSRCWNVIAEPLRALAERFDNPAKY